MLLYMGSGSALASYRLKQRVRVLADCASICGVATRRFAERLESNPDGRACSQLVRGMEAATDCVGWCSLAASLMGRVSELSPFSLAPCAEACRRCAEACDALSPEEVATEGAELCRRAERICRQATARGSA